MLSSYQLKPMKFLPFFILLLIFQRPIRAEDQIVTDCSAESSNFTSGSQFETNLKILLSNLSKNGPLNREGFYYTSYGDDPNIIYGFSQCMSAASEETCRRCLVDGSTEITKLCTKKRGASVRFYNCILLYSHLPILSQASNQLYVYMWNTGNVSNKDAFNKILEGFMNDLSSAASSRPSKYAQSVANYSDFEKIYGMAQCTRDLSALDCSSCLEKLVSDIPICCDGKRGGNIYSISCNIRYDMYRFFDSSSPPPSPSLISPSPSVNSTSKDPQDSGTPIAAIVIPIVIGVMLLSLAIACFIRRRSKKTNQEKKEFSQEELLHDLGPLNSSTLFLYGNNKETGQVRSKELPFIDLATIVAATNNFSNDNKLGEGGFGPVYKGILPNEKEIAVKRLSRSSGQGLEEFKNEITLIAKLQHKNLVRLLYCCIEKNEKILIYEYMPNTSLDFFLFNPNRRIQLDWGRRYNIIVGIVRGLLYLHEDSRLKIIHRDMKASNVLLDHDMNPKISDFGMARIFQGNQGEANTNRVVGTYGYMAPEYAMEGLFSVKSDIFSFGVLLLEIVTGKRNGRFVVGEQAQSLLTYAWQVWSCGQGLELIDPQIIETCSVDEALKCIHIGLLCVQDDAANRPSMSTVFHMLGSESVALPSPTKPAFYTGNVVPVSNGSSTSAKTCSVNQITMSDIEAR